MHQHRGTEPVFQGQGNGGTEDIEEKSEGGLLPSLLLLSTTGGGPDQSQSGEAESIAFENASRSNLRVLPRSGRRWPTCERMQRCDSDLFLFVRGVRRSNFGPSWIQSSEFISKRASVIDLGMRRWIVFMRFESDWDFLDCRSRGPIWTSEKERLRPGLPGFFALSTTASTL